MLQSSQQEVFRVCRCHVLESIPYFSSHSSVPASESIPLPSFVPLSVPAPVLNDSSPVSQEDTTEPFAPKPV